jgi:hypothetical protein
MNFSRNTLRVAVLVTGLLTLPSFAQNQPGIATSPAPVDRTVGQADRGYGETNRDRGFNWGWLGLLGLAGLMGSRRSVMTA